MEFPAREAADTWAWYGPQPEPDMLREVMAHWDNPYLPGGSPRKRRSA